MEQQENKRGPFVSFVLLDSPLWDKEQFLAGLWEDWGLTIEEQDGEDRPETLIVSNEDALFTVSLMPAPVPNDEAVNNAGSNYLWPEAEEVAKRHTAHLLVAVMPREGDNFACGSMLVMLCDTALKAENAIGVYTSGTVFEPALYHESASALKNGGLPIFNWVFFGLRQAGEGLFSGYTLGLESFGKREIEVLDTTAEPLELRNFLYDIAYYILDSDVTLEDGETIGFSEEQVLPITLSEGFNLEGETLKIGYKPVGV